MGNNNVILYGGCLSSFQAGGGSCSRWSLDFLVFYGLVVRVFRTTDGVILCVSCLGLVVSGRDLADGIVPEQVTFLSAWAQKWPESLHLLCK